MIVDKTKRKVAFFLKEFYQVANVGAGGSSTNPNANELDVPILAANVATTNTLSSAATVDFSVSLTGSQLEGNTIREFGVFSATMPTDAEIVNIDSGSWTASNKETTMLSRLNFDAIGPFSNSDQIDIVLTVEVE
jgi:hypothetical protein